jgi:hypothetical protein
MLQTDTEKWNVHQFMELTESFRQGQQVHYRNTDCTDNVDICGLPLQHHRRATFGVKN